MKNVITIGREYGSGGQDLGIKLAEELGFKFYNKQLISDLADQLMLPENFIEQAEAQIPKRNIFQEIFPFWNNDANRDMHIFDEQGKFICKLAADGNCVFAGRRADYYLRDNENAMHFFFYAPLEYRIQHVMESENLSRDEAVEKIDTMDRMRKNSYEYTTGRKWGVRGNYDMMIDSSNYETEELVKLLADIIRRTK